MRKGEAELVSIIVCPCPGPLLGLFDSVLFLPFVNTHSTTLCGPPRASVGGRGPPAGTPHTYCPGDGQRSQNGCSHPLLTVRLQLLGLPLLEGVQVRGRKAVEYRVSGNRLFLSPVA